jgi:pimeloyl-ACP methyl ester carboxylesterase
MIVKYAVMKNVFLILSCLVLFGCSGAPTNHSNTNNTSQTQTGNTSANGEPMASSQTVTIDSPDGVKIVGTFLRSDKPNSPALLLLHQWQSDRHSYDEFATRMNAKGFNVLAIDGRGFGESTKKADGSAVIAERSDEAVKEMLGDVGSAVEFLKKQQNVDPTKIAIVGASYGSSLAIMYAADHPEIHVIALLSPGLNYFGTMQTHPAVERYGDRDLFTVASRGDTESAEAADDFMKIGNALYGFMILPKGNAHGTEMFKYREKADGPPIVENALEGFLTTRLGLAAADHK